MRKIIVLVAALLSFGAFSSVAQASTVDSCLDFGAGQNNCSVGTAETDVNFATVNFGLHSYGSFQLVCADYNGRVVKFKQGRVARNGTRTFFTEGLFGFRSPDCVLTAQAFSVRDGQNARVRVTLVN